MVKTVQKFQPPHGRRPAVARGRNFRSTKNAFQILFVFFRKIPEISFPEISESYFKKREF